MKRYLESNDSADNMEYFIDYIKQNAMYAMELYNPDLFNGQNASVIEPELRASVLIWRACSETSVQNMVSLFKEALRICPVFHEEIKKLLSVLNVGV